MHIRKQVKLLLKSARCGLWSGYPPCCVAYQVFLWSPALSLAVHMTSPENTIAMSAWNIFVDMPHSLLMKIGDKYFRGYSTDHTRYKYKPWNRVTCPLCTLIAHPTEVNDCDNHRMCDGQ